MQKKRRYLKYTRMQYTCDNDGNADDDRNYWGTVSGDQGFRKVFYRLDMTVVVQFIWVRVQTNFVDAGDRRNPARFFFAPQGKVYGQAFRISKKQWPLL